jgi:hypothetical protein
MNLAQFEKQFNDAKEVYHEIMRGENDAALLFKWMVENDINAHSVFHDPFASSCYTLEGFVGMYRTLHHALFDDGDVTFVKTKIHSPMVVFIWKNETNFMQLYKKSLGDNRSYNGYQVVGYCDTVQDYITEYNRVNQEHEQMYADMEEWAKSNER